METVNLFFNNETTLVFDNETHTGKEFFFDLSSRQFDLLLGALEGAPAHLMVAVDEDGFTSIEASGEPFEGRSFRIAEGFTKSPNRLALISECETTGMSRWVEEA